MQPTQIPEDMELIVTFKAELLYVEWTICLSTDKAMNQDTSVIPEHHHPKVTEQSTLN